MPFWPEGLAAGAARTVSAQTSDAIVYIKGTDEIVAYGKTLSFRDCGAPNPMADRIPLIPLGSLSMCRPPIQESVGVITPSALHYIGTTRGHYIPDIYPEAHKPYDPRHGRSSTDLQFAGFETFSFRHSLTFYRVCGESSQC